MASHKTARASEEIKKELSELMRELKDPRVANTMLSVVKLDLTNDLSHCTIYISSLEGIDKTKDSIKGLESASGYIRRELASRLRIRKMPELHFVADDGIEYSANLNKIMRNLSKDNKDEHSED